MAEHKIGALPVLMTGRRVGSGALHAPPPRHDTVASRAVLAAICGPVLVGLLLLGAGLLAHQAVDRRRLATWEADWSVTGPHWTNR